MCRGYLPLAPVIAANLSSSLRRDATADNGGPQVVLFAPDTGEALATVYLGVKFLCTGVPESAVAGLLPTDEKTSLMAEGCSCRSQKVENYACLDRHACSAGSDSIFYNSKLNKILPSDPRFLNYSLT